MAEVPSLSTRGHLVEVIVPTGTRGHLVEVIVPTGTGTTHNNSFKSINGAYNLA